MGEGTIPRRDSRGPKSRTPLLRLQLQTRQPPQRAKGKTSLNSMPQKQTGSPANVKHTWMRRWTARNDTTAMLVHGVLPDQRRQHPPTHPTQRTRMSTPILPNQHQLQLQLQHKHKHHRQHPFKPGSERTSQGRGQQNQHMQLFLLALALVARHAVEHGQTGQAGRIERTEQTQPPHVDRGRQQLHSARDLTRRKQRAGVQILQNRPTLLQPTALQLHGHRGPKQRQLRLRATTTEAAQNVQEQPPGKYPPLRRGQRSRLRCFLWPRTRHVIKGTCRRHKAFTRKQQTSLRR